MVRACVIAIFMFGVAAVNEADDKKNPAKLPKPYEEVVKVRRFLGNRLIEKVDEAYAFRKEVKGETVIYVRSGDPKERGTLEPLPGSEITDEAGVVYVVTASKEAIDAIPQHRCTVKKKDPQPPKK